MSRLWAHGLAQRDNQITSDRIDQMETVLETSRIFAFLTQT